MTRSCRSLAAAGLLGLLAAPAALRAQTARSAPPAVQALVPASPAPWFVHDGGPVLSAGERVALQMRISAVQLETGGDIAVLILRDLEGRAPADVAVAAYRAWGVGRVDSVGSARRGLGALLLLVPKELAPDGRGRCWITTGLGAEGALTDAAAAAICRDAVVPALRERRYAAAVDSGVARIGLAFAEATAGLGAPEAVGAAAAPGVRPAAADDEPPAVALAAVWVAVLGGGAGAVVLGRRYLRRRPRPCPRGHGPMARLAEEADDAALAPGQRTEERLGSVDYDVWACAHCDARAVVAYPRMLSGYAGCPRCRSRAVGTGTRTLRAATVGATGLEEVTARCRHCDWREVTRRVTPAVVVTSGSSGSGGLSGFSSGSGGGSSSGGGFGGSGATAGGGGGSSY